MLVISETNRLVDVNSFQMASIYCGLLGENNMVECGHLQHWVNEKATQKSRVMRVAQGYCPLLRHLTCKSKELTGLLLKTLV